MNNFNQFNQNLPHNFEAEQSILGCIIKDFTLFNKIAHTLKPENFYIDLHKEIFTVLLKMYADGDLADIITAAEKCVSKAVFKNSGDAKCYLFKLCEAAISPGSIDSYVKIVQDKHYARLLMSAADELYSTAKLENLDSEALIELAEAKIYSLRQGQEIGGMKRFKPILDDVIDDIKTVAENGRPSGIPTGYKSLDNLLFGLQGGDLILIAGRPAMGKTTYAVNIAVKIVRNGGKAAIISLEMSKESLVKRILSSLSNVDGKSLHFGNLSHSDWKSVHGISAEWQNAALYIDDTPNVTIGGLKAKLRRLGNISLVVIDYLQLMSAGRKDGNRVLEISEITRNLKIMAKELDIPVILCSQLSRASETRTDKRPQLADLRDSGAIEQDADAVIFLYREHYYRPDADEHAAEAIIAKNRRGKTGSLPLYFDGEYSRFFAAETTAE